MRPPGPRAGPRWQFLSDDLLKKLRLDSTISEWRNIHALPGQSSVSFRIERRAFNARGVDPRGKSFRWQCKHIKMHIRETIAAILAREPKKCSSSVCLQV